MLRVGTRRLGTLAGAGMSCVLAAALLLPGAAAAKIVVGQSIAKITLGMSSSQVKKVLGPTEYVYGPTDPLNVYGGTEWQYVTEPYTTPYFGKRGVTVVTTTSTAQKTSKGIAVGSSVSRFRKAYPKADCSLAAFGFCTVSSTYLGKPVTTSFVFAQTGTTIESIEIGDDCAQILADAC
jgi:hypothetical protein